MTHENLWAPWRMTYLRELNRKASQIDGDRNPAPSQSPGGFLAQYWSQPEHDQRHLIIFRNAHGIILLNRYPYANGHLMIALGEPRPTLLDYDPPQRLEFWKLIEIATDLMQRALNPQGINLGINQGAAAGAGVPEHLHAHLVPRWHGDTNFMAVAGNVRVIPDALEAMCKQYRDTVKSIAV